jgi:2-dehydro-3-deoxygluconokinase
MTPLRIKPAVGTAFDLVSLGEVMLRFDPGDERIRSTRSFRVWEGGGEYNVARALRRTFGLRTAVATALVDNEVGRLVEDLMLQGGVDTSLVQWRPHDGAGRSLRNGLNFTERGFGVRGGVGISDRGHTAVAALRPDDLEWATVFGERGARWFHSGGIFAGLSESTPEVAAEAMATARDHGTVVSYDINYRPSLWADRGGPEAATKVNAELLSHVDVLFANGHDLARLLGCPAPVVTGPEAAADALHSLAPLVQEKFPRLRVIAATARTVTSASTNDWGGLAWVDGTVVASLQRPGLAILDRVGGGDGFAAGLIYGLLESGELSQGASRGISRGVELGAALGALAMTTPGDNVTVSLAEVLALAGGAGAAVRR